MGFEKNRRGKRDRQGCGLAWKGKCSWRKKQIRKKARKSTDFRPGYVLAGMLALEFAVLAGRTGDFSVIRQQEEYRAEWFLPPGGNGQEEADIYGIRIHPETWELQFYHRREYFRRTRQ